MTNRLVIAALAIVLVSPMPQLEMKATAQTEDSVDEGSNTDEVRPDRRKRGKRKNRKLRRQRPSRQPGRPQKSRGRMAPKQGQGGPVTDDGRVPPSSPSAEPTTGAEPATEQKPSDKKDSGSSVFLPDWGTPKFGLILQPILGYEARKYSEGGVTIGTTIFEGGLRVGLKNVPLPPGNPGFYISPAIGYARGAVSDLEVSGLDSKVDGYEYSRTWGSSDFVLLLGWYRHRLSIARGVIEPSEGDNTHSATLQNDFGVMLIPMISGHYTLTFKRAFSSGLDDYYLGSTDHWLHARFEPGILSLYVDTGPGVTQVEEYSDGVDPRTKLASGTTQYFKLLSGMSLFWKIGGDASLRYVIAASADDLGAYTNRRLPESELNQPTVTPLPEDSLAMTAFFGIRNLFYGLSVGWQYQLTTIYLSDAKKRQSARSSGFGVQYQLTL